MNQCPFCKDGVLTRQTLKKTYTYQGHSLEVNQPGEWCNVCGEGILNGADLAATDRPLRDFQARIDGLLTANEIRKIRKKLRLTQKQVAEILGEEPKVFGRYERGEMTPKRTICQLLRLLNNHPEQLQELMGSGVQ